MDGVAVGNDLVIDAIFFELLLKGGHLGGLHHGIVRAAQGEDLGLDLRARRNRLGIEPAVEADHALEVEPVTSHLDNPGATKAIADSGDAGGIERRLLEQRLVGCAGTFAKKRTVAFVKRGFLAIVGHRCWANFLAVDIGGESDVPQLRQLIGISARRVGDPAPIVNEDHAGALTGQGIVVGEITLQRGTFLVGIVDRFGDEFGLGHA